MATNDLSGRTARRLRLTLAKRLAEANAEASTESESIEVDRQHECKRLCLVINSNDKDGADDHDELGSSCSYDFLDEESTSGCRSLGSC